MMGRRTPAAGLTRLTSPTMNDNKPNPYEPPQTQFELPPAEPHRPIGVLGWIVIVPLATISAAIAFACTCVPLGWMAGGSEFQFYSAWVCGVLVGVVIGFLVAWGLLQQLRTTRQAGAKGFHPDRSRQPETGHVSMSWWWHVLINLLSLAAAAGAFVSIGLGVFGLLYAGYGTPRWADTLSYGIAGVGSVFAGVLVNWGLRKLIRTVRRYE